ncbi:WG repeat-containing protein [Salinispora arenicola]|uniref:WG repeat-containing protein n=1 Tax=Salinispora arenicola TaxID=168697 RepID=UPI001E3FA9F8|nr:WG repeat-containing protein [Salinispora arenicola]
MNRGYGDRWHHAAEPPWMFEPTNEWRPQFPGQRYPGDIGIEHTPRPAPRGRAAVVGRAEIPPLAPTRPDGTYVGRSWDEQDDRRARHDDETYRRPHDEAYRRGELPRVDDRGRRPEPLNARGGEPPWERGNRDETGRGRYADHGRYDDRRPRHESGGRDQPVSPARHPEPGWLPEPDEELPRGHDRYAFGRDAGEPPPGTRYPWGRPGGPDRGRPGEPPLSGDGRSKPDWSGATRDGDVNPYPRRHPAGSGHPAGRDAPSPHRDAAPGPGRHPGRYAAQPPNPNRRPDTAAPWPPPGPPRPGPDQPAPQRGRPHGPPLPPPSRSRQGGLPTDTPRAPYGRPVSGAPNGPTSGAPSRPASGTTGTPPPPRPPQGHPGDDVPRRPPPPVPGMAGPPPVRPVSPAAGNHRDRPDQARTDTGADRETGPPPGTAPWQPRRYVPPPASPPLTTEPAPAAGPPPGRSGPGAWFGPAVSPSKAAPSDPAAPSPTAASDRSVEGSDATSPPPPAAPAGASTDTAPGRATADTEPTDTAPAAVADTTNDTEPTDTAEDAEPGRATANTEPTDTAANTQPGHAAPAAVIGSDDIMDDCPTPVDDDALTESSDSTHADANAEPAPEGAQVLVEPAPPLTPSPSAESIQVISAPPAPQPEGDPAETPKAVAPPSEAPAPVAVATPTARHDMPPAGDTAPADPERVLANHPWRLDPTTLREVVTDPEQFRGLRHRLTEKLDTAIDNRSRARLLSLRAVVSRAAGDLDDALADGRLALTYAEATGELRRSALAQARLAHVLRWRGEYDEADRLFAQANSPELPDRLRAALHEHAGRCCVDQGRLVEACVHFERALDLRGTADPTLLDRVRVSLDAVADRAAATGFGPYPRSRAEVLEPERPPVPARDGSLWGYADPNGDLVVAAEYAEVQPFQEGLAWARRPDDQRWSLLDRTGTTVLAASWLEAGPFADGLAWVSQGEPGGWCAIDPHGEVVVPPGFAEVRPFRRGIAVVRREGWGAVDRAGRLVVPTRYHGFATVLADDSQVDGFTDDGLAVVDLAGRYGVVDRTGQVVVPPAHAALVVHPVAFLVATAAGRWGALDRQGEPLIDPTHTDRAMVLAEIDQLLTDAVPVL